MDYKTVRIFNVNVYELHTVLKLIKDFDDKDMLNLNLDEWNDMYQYLIKNFYDIDVNEVLTTLKQQASKFLKYTFKNDCGLLGKSISFNFIINSNIIYKKLTIYIFR